MSQTNAGKRIKWKEGLSEYTGKIIGYSQEDKKYLVKRYDAMGWECHGAQYQMDCGAKYGDKNLWWVGTERLTETQDSIIKNIMGTISATLKRILDPKYKSLVDAGIMDSELNLTQLGLEELHAIQLIASLDKLAERAVEIIEESKK
jgi:hypothetical protein